MSPGLIRMGLELIEMIFRLIGDVVRCVLRRSFPVQESFAGQHKLEAMMENRTCINYLLPESQRYLNILNYEPHMPKKRLACFVVFLLEILDAEAPTFSSRGKYSYTLLQKKLTFLHTFLGDTPFQNIELEGTKILFEFESIANEVGGFIYSCVSIPTKKLRMEKFDAGIHDLLDKVETFMNKNIKEHCTKELPETATSMSSPLSSLFIMKSLIEDLEGLISDLFEEYIDSIKDQINTLNEELTFMVTFFKDIEKSQVMHANDEMEKDLIHIIDASYEAEYLINTHTTGHIPSWYLNLRLPIIVRKIQTFGTRVRNVEKINCVKNIKIQALRYPREDARIVVGFEDTRNIILADLVGRSTKLEIVSVFGMSGIGKTTLANKLYNDLTVSEYFDLRVWCTVSQAYDKHQVFHDIWLNLPIKSDKDGISKENFESLALEIYQTLMGRKYLIIMDDVWDSFIWDELRRYFPDNGNGSRILLTSQIKDSAPANSIFHSPPLLPNSQCYALLVRSVFGKEPCPFELRDTAKRIASKCNGLPLAVVVVAGVLANVGKGESTWKNVEQNLGLYISDDSSMNTLELSYKYLPNHLKPCFLCLGWSFSCKYMPTRDIIPLWISHGFVQKEENKSQEEIAQEYLWDLIKRSLLSVSARRSDGEIKACETHDLIFKMCRRKAEEEKFIYPVDTFPAFMYNENPHLYLCSEPGNICNISALHCRSVSGWTPRLGHNLTRMPLLRVIDNQESSIDERIGGLVHLRYFSSYLQMQKFPQGICKLVNLEYLFINTTFKVDVPSTILKMVKLKHVCIAAQLMFLKSCDISEIKNNVKSLSRVRLRNHEDEDVLKCSPNLIKLKCICEGLFPDLTSLTLLESLNISIFDSPHKGRLITNINFPFTLRKLSLSGTNMPWEESSIVGRLPNLCVLKLFYDAFCGSEWKTRDDEFQELRFLKIYNIPSLRQWTTCSEHFPKLQCLVLAHVRVEIPLEFGDIATLQTIEVHNCRDEVYTSAIHIQEEQEEYGNADLKIITRGRKTKDDLAGDEMVPKVLQESQNVEVTSKLREALRGSPAISLQFRPLATRICAGCLRKIAIDECVNAGGTNWHRECFCCHACKQRIYDNEVTMSDYRAYHYSCFKDLCHPKCYVCKDFVRTNADGNFDLYECKFWDQSFCRSHLTDGTPLCCSCGRREPVDSTYFSLGEGWALCIDCMESSITDTDECQPLYMEIRQFFEGLNIKVEQHFPVRLVDRQAINEATAEGSVFLSYLHYTKDDSKVINELIVLSGLPRILTGYFIALRMMEAWMYLEGYLNLSRKAGGGVKQVLVHMWLSHEIVSGSHRKGNVSEFEKRLGEYRKYQIENTTLDDGFREGKKAVEKYGLKHTLDHIRHTGTFPHAT